MASFSMKETTPTKLNTIAFKAGQYIHCINEDGTFAIYYDSIIKNSRVMIKSGSSSDTSWTDDEVNSFNEELWENS